MVAHDSIKKVFQLYFGKHFSMEGRSLFGRWLRAESNSQKKEEQLQHIWSMAEGEITDETRHDWKLLQSQIHKVSPKIFYVQWLKYAAVILLFFLSIGGAYFTAVQRTLHQPVELAEIFVPYGESKKFVLPDSSKVWLNAGSTIVYAKDFENLKLRSVYLTGEASFSVTKNKEKPFIVKTAKMDVEALGTIFTVESYPEELFTTATLEEGKVKVSLTDNQSLVHILDPSDQLVYSHVDGTVQRNRVDIDDLKEQREGYLIFSNTSLKEIFLTLERKYGITIQYNSSRYGSDLYNLKFSPNETIENVLIVLQQLIGFSYKTNDKCIIIN